MTMLLDRQESTLNPSTTIVSIALGSKDVQGNIFCFSSEYIL